MQADPVSPRNADLRDLTGDDPHVQLLLTLARTHLGMEVAWLSMFTADQQVSRGADGSVAAMNVPVREGTDLASSFCARVLTGILRSAVNDARSHPITRELPITAQLTIVRRWVRLK